MPATRKPPAIARVEDSELYLDDAHAAQQLWNLGYRPVLAEDVLPGDTVAFTQTLLGYAFGEFKFGTVSDVGPPMMSTIVIAHDGITTEADEWSQVWVKRRD